MVLDPRLELGRGCPHWIFLPSTLFNASCYPTGVWSLDYSLTLAVFTTLGPARLVSTPSFLVSVHLSLYFLQEGLARCYLSGYPKQSKGRLRRV